METSLPKTLADKHRSSATKTARKHKAAIYTPPGRSQVAGGAARGSSPVALSSARAYPAHGSAPLLSK